MKDIFIVSPVKTPDNIREFCKKTKCREFYVYHHRFINDNFEYIEEYIKAAHECNARIFVNFKHSIDEEEVSKTKKFIEFLHSTKIDGIFVNSYGILEIIKTMDLPFKVNDYYIIGVQLHWSTSLNTEGILKPENLTEGKESFADSELSDKLSTTTLLAEVDLKEMGAEESSDGSTLYIPPVSVEGAKANLEAELPGWDLDAVAEAADKAWNSELSRIRIETGDESVRKIFYTALYHTMIAPSLFCDVDGNYYGADHQIHASEGFTNYTTFSLWDVYRAAMPLMTIIHQDRVADMVNTMLNIYQQQGELPVWHLMGCETDCMVGNPGIMPVADAILKGFDGFDKELAYEALKNTAMVPDRGQDLRMKYGYIPCDLFNEAVAYDMEYAIADGSVAAVAKALGKEDDYNYFLERSHSYRNFFDPETRFMRGKDSKGRFRTPFNPFSSTHRADDYCEGNAWQYTWLAPHDFDGLVGCFGSEGAFLDKLDSLFIVSPEVEGANTSPDISGLIGQYAHGNEPSHHVLYFYTMAGQPWKTADKVREVLTTLYHDAPDGLSGNEDVGQMSALYILSSLVFYQVNVAEPLFWFGYPLVDTAEISLPDGKFTIETLGRSDSNRYIQSVTLNGEPYNKPYIDFKDIKAGNTLVFTLGPDQTKWY